MRSLLGLALCACMLPAWARAQEPTPRSEAPAAVAETAPEAGGSASPTNASRAAAIAALREEVAALKAKADEAELAALMVDPAAEASTEEPPLRLYGFMDFGMDKFFFSEGTKSDDFFALLRPTPSSTFVLGNINLYFDATPIEHLRTLVELRFTTAPHGEETSLGPPLGSAYQRTDTLAFDFSAPSAQTQLRLGGIFIERAWTQYEFSNLFKLQWGLFLNPFGIWNIDHGSPTLIGLMLPTFIASQMIPTRLLGLNLCGSAFSGNTEIGYSLHVTNGRSPIDYDMTEEKAVGGRLYVAHESDFGRLVLGTSGYVGTYADQQKVLDLAHPGKNHFDWVASVAYKEQIVGFDAALDIENLRIRSETVFRWIEYDNGKHERIFTTDGSVQYLPSRLEYATYVMAAYRTPWRIEPYAEVELAAKSFVLPRFAGSARATSSDSAAIVPSFGLNFEVSPQLLIKSQLALVRIVSPHDLGLKAWFGDHYSFQTPIFFIRAVSTF